MSEREDILSGLPDIVVPESASAADTIPSKPVREDKGSHASKPKKTRGKRKGRASGAKHDETRLEAADEATDAEAAKASPDAGDAESADDAKADAAKAPEREAKRGAHARSESDDAEKGAGFSIPTLEELEAERERHRSIVRKRVIAGRVGTIVIVAAAVAAICVTFFTPMLSITGESMSPTLNQGNYVLCARTTSCDQGDVIAFYLDNKVLVKRVIATEGQWVDIDQQGNVYVDGQMLDEPYIDSKAVGKCDIVLPCLVGEGEMFVMGDNRSNSVDSRSASVGCVDSSQVVGKIFVKVMPPGGIA